MEKHERIARKDQSRPPYTRVENVDLTSGDWTPDFYVCELRVKLESTVNINTAADSAVDLYATDYDIFLVNVTKINRAGCSAAIQNATSVVALGFDSADVSVA